jgi:hypothetical protein
MILFTKSFMLTDGHRGLCHIQRKQVLRVCKLTEAFLYRLLRKCSDYHSLIYIYIFAVIKLINCDSNASECG